MSESTATESIHERIRKLFALAEGASTQEEADAAANMAMKLVNKYAVDLAMLQDKRGDKGKPISRLVTVTNPYARPKAVLLNAICLNYGVQAIRLRGEGVMLVGFEGDIEAVELLYASLSVQVFAAGERAVRTRIAWGGRGDTRSFKTGFLYGFASEVNDRLKAAKRETLDETPGAALVLRDRSKDVEAAFKELYPKTSVSRSAGVRSNDGVRAGRAAGARADLGQSRFAGGRTALGA